MEPSDTTSESLREPRRSLRTPQKPGFYTLKRFRVTPTSASSDRKKSCSVSKKSSNQPTTPLRGGPRRRVPGASTSLAGHGDAAGAIAEFVYQNSSSELYLGILMATNNRPYSEWWDENNTLINMCGALIPEGYQKDPTNEQRPWVCPIRSCRMLCVSAQSLGWHFTKKHKSVDLNDNGDGTFSVVGTHPGEKPRVVSKKALDPCEPAKAETQHAWLHLPRYSGASMPNLEAARIGKQDKGLQTQAMVHADKPSEDVGYRARPHRIQATHQKEEDDSDDDIPLSLSRRRVDPGKGKLVRPKAPSETVSRDAVLALEKWEKQGGRIVSTKTAWSTDIAYSGAYMAAARAIPISDRLTIMAVRLLPRGKHQFDKDDTVDRICTLAKGKLEIRLDDEPSFRLSPGGLFRVNVGGSCSVKNVSNVEAALNVTVVQVRQ